MRLRTALTIAMAMIVVASIMFALSTKIADRLPAPLGQACEVRTPSGEVFLDSDQMANAATIAAVGIRQKLPDRAVVVALATAFQESKLQNLSGGDRDSVGLFQQRPSQGWGTPAQIADPRYAAGRFYAALIRVRGWERMRVTEAAQKVQRSAYPEAYERWADEAGVLAEALAGHATSAVTCTWAGEPTRRGADAAQALGTGLRLDWGEVSTITSPDAVQLILAAADERAGWQYAHWIVAHSAEKGVERVSFGNKEWSAGSGAWLPVSTPVAERVVASVYPPSPPTAASVALAHGDNGSDHPLAAIMTSGS